MKFPITALVAITSTTLVSAAPSSNPASLFERQAECAAVNEACLNPSSQSTLVSILSAVPFLSIVLGGLSVSQVTDKLTCCPGATCAGGTAAVPSFLTPTAALLLGGLPYQSCTDF